MKKKLKKRSPQNRHEILKKEKKFRKILSFINLVMPLIMFTILLFSNFSDSTIYLMIFTLLVGWAIPYFVLLITGLYMKKKNHPKLAFLFNILNIILCFFLIYFIIKLYDNGFLVMLIEYIIITIISILNAIYYKNYIKNHSKINIENDRIKKEKKKNNGAIV